MPMNHLAQSILTSCGLWAVRPDIQDTLEAMLLAMTEEQITAAMSSASSSSDDPKPPYATENGVATIPLHGLMMKGEPWMIRWFGGTSTADFSSAVSLAASDPNVKAILLDIDSPGGLVDGTADAADAVASARKVKPTYGHVTDTCCSAALYVGSQAQGLYANKGADIGSIGVRTSRTDYSKAFAKEGITVHPISTGKHKAAGLPGTEITEEQLAEVQRQVDAHGALFVNAIASGRKMKREDAQALADGRIWIASDAHKKGLIDGVASRQAVMDALSAYRPGRTAVHIAADAAGERTMSLWDQLKEALGSVGASTDPAKPAETQIQTEPAKPGANAAASSETQTAAANAIKTEFETAMNAQKAEIDRLKAAHEEQVKAANRSACEAFMRAGHFTAADLEKNVERREKAPEIFDALMAERPVSALLSDMIEGEKAVAKVDPSAASSFTEECRKYLSAQYPGMAARATAQQNGGS